MSAPEGNKNAAKPAAEKRQAPAIYLRPTPAERKEIMRWARGQKLSRVCIAAVLSVVRGTPFEQSEHFGSPDGELETLNTRQMPFEPLGASDCSLTLV